MKKVMVLTAVLLMSGLAVAQAQSGAAQKEKMSQTQGTGVPYNKAQPGNTATKKPDHNIPNPGVQAGPDAKATGQFSPGSHTAQREHKIGRKTRQVDPVPKSDKPKQ